MATALKQSPMPLRDVLYEFAISKETPDAELIDDFARRYPQYACEITNFAIEVVCESIEGDEETCPISVARVSPAVSRAMSKYQSTLHALKEKGTTTNAVKVVKESSAIDVFAGLDQSRFRALAKSLNVNSIFLCKIRDRQITPTTIRAGFLRLLGEKLEMAYDTVLAYVNSKPLAMAVQYYKADEKPVVGIQQSYEDAVRNSGLSEEQQKYLLSI